MVNFDRALLVPGANVSMSGQVQNGAPMVQLINPGRNGFILLY